MGFDRQIVESEYVYVDFDGERCGLSLQRGGSGVAGNISRCFFRGYVGVGLEYSRSAAVIVVLGAGGTGVGVEGAKSDEHVR